MLISCPGKTYEERRWTLRKENEITLLLTAYCAAAAKSLQSCPTLCDPIDGSPPCSPVAGILQARTLEWVAISFSNAWKVRRWVPVCFLMWSISSVQFSHSVVSDSLQPHEPQHTRPPCPSPTPGVHSNSCPLSHWCHPAISSSVVLFSSCLQSFPASGSFQISQSFQSSGQRNGASASASVLPMNIQDWFPLGLTGLISLQSKGLSRVFINTTVQKYQFFGAQSSL